MYGTKAIELMEVHPIEGTCEANVSHKSSTFRAELTQTRGIGTVPAIIVHIVGKVPMAKGR